MGYKIDHTLGHKIRFSEFKTPGVRQNLLSNYNEAKLEISNRKRTGKSPNSWKLINTLLNNAYVTEEVSREIPYQKLWDTKIVL